VDPALLGEARAQDAALARCGVDIWVGAEPTFTDRRSQEPWWLGQPEGGDKEARARVLLLALAPHLAGPVRLLRAEGRLYPGERTPRFCLGALFSRRGEASGAAADGAALAGDPVAAPVPAAAEAWLTVTPDPGVVEVNMAPAHDLVTFAGWCDAVYAAASDAGLAPVRYRYNGDVTDSGGGGQVTFGGPSPEASPFFVRPQLLPRLVRYANRHPSLSYLFAPECVGSASQGPRADEGVRERFEELPVALGRLAARATPEELWGALAPLLVDSAGNSHRAELNIEKLWNPWLPGRGRLGVVELRALRMPRTPERLVAIAALFRAVAARLATVAFDEPLVDWGGSLHELFGLLWFLQRDLEAVLDDLDAHGLGLGPLLRAELTQGREPVAELALDDATLEVTQALAFWPLVGDVASQERSGARLVDASSARLQLLVTTPQGSSAGTLTAQGWRVPLQAIAGSAQRHLGSVLFRAFTPVPGLHPGLPPTDPLVLAWQRGGRGVAVALHGWRPGGGAYDGLPADDAEARRRRRERTVVSAVEHGEIRAARDAGLTVDLRRAEAPGIAPLTLTLPLPSASPSVAVQRAGLL
jgi:uncharacterized protein (DUF2126 family)